MKDIMIKCVLSSAFSLILFINLAEGQDLHQTYRIADSLYQAGEIEESVSLYKRIAFFDKQAVYDSIVFPRLANGFYQIRDFENASRYFEYAYNINEDIDFLYDQVLMQILSGNYKLAKLNLLNVSTGGDDEVLARKLALQAMVEFKLEDYEKATAYLDRFYDHTPFADSLDFNIIERTAKIQRKYKKSKVKAMSLILPGAGQIYCGEIKDGLNSLAVTALFGYLYFRVVNTLGIIDAFIAVVPWYQKYYIGGYNKAGVFAEAKQEELIDELFNRLVVNLQGSLSGYSR